MLRIHGTSCSCLIIHLFPHLVLYHDVLPFSQTLAFAAARPVQKLARLALNVNYIFFSFLFIRYSFTLIVVSRPFVKSDLGLSNCLKDFFWCNLFPVLDLWAWRCSSLAPDTLGICAPSWWKHHRAQPLLQNPIAVYWR